jgi:hypothetical protein
MAGTRGLQAELPNSDAAAVTMTATVVRTVTTREGYRRMLGAARPVTDLFTKSQF